jgi:hypothetical protein
VAARQFHRLGFHQVSMADVAAAVGLTAPANLGRLLAQDRDSDD